MNILQIKLFATTIISLFTLDFLWLGFLAKGFYQKHLGFLMAKNINWLPAVAFYFIYTFGFLVLVVSPSIGKISLANFLFRSAVFGLVSYSTYNLANWAIIKSWPAVVVAVDIFWGVFVTVMTALIVYFLNKK